MQEDQRLRPVWEAIIQIYRVYEDICRRHGLRWYLAYGSALGAVRHNGFIPWDDDFDVLMPRADYNKFWEIAKVELPSQYKIVTLKNTISYALPWGKIMETRENVLDKLSTITNCEFPQGLFIDVFPLDGCYTDVLHRYSRKIYSALLICRERWVLNELRPSFSSKISKIIGFFLKPIFNNLKTKHDFVMFDDYRLSVPSYGTTEMCAHANNEIGDFGDNRKMPVDCYGEPEWIEFEGIGKVPVPQDWNQYLTGVFGNYMKLPPPEKQISSHEGESVVPWRLGPENNR